MKIVAFVPAKAHSDRVANKNLAILDGEHLFKRKLQQLVDVDSIDAVYLDTESDALAARAKDLNVTRLNRPESLASNAADGHDIFAYECAAVPDADIYIQALCTAPFVGTDTLQRALKALLDNPDADSLVAVRVTKQYLWRDGQPLYEPTGRIPNSVDLPETFIEGMSLYMVRRKLGDPPPKRRIGMKPILFPLTPTEDIDINYPMDLELAEKICAGERAKVNLSLNILRAHLSSPILADITKEMELNAVLAPNIHKVSGHKILGIAKTLNLAELTVEDKKRDVDSWKGIYAALGSYQFIRPGDVIMVSTEVPTKAYFGDLNANLAIRSGAQGAIIDGFTRDTADVSGLGFTVFAHGSHCSDIKYEGTVESMNAPIMIGKVSVRNGDYVFADCDGIVVIPRKLWPEVERRAWDSLRNEAEIRLNMMQGRSIEQILDLHGAF